MDTPTVQINADGLQNLVRFIFAHEHSLKQFGAIKIQLNSECLLALKKRKSPPFSTCTQHVTKIGKDELIYSVQNSEVAKIYTEQRAPITNEATFWSSLSRSDYTCHQSSVSILKNKSLFYQKWQRIYFDIHSLPRQSILKLGGRKVTDQFTSCLRRAHGPGAIFPLECARQRLSLLDYHHEGGARHWYIIPSRERDNLYKVFKQQNSSACFEHEKLLIDPSLLDKHHIQYHQLVQYPNELVVVASGALAQSFTEDPSWSESIAFALPSWIEDGHASARDPSCQCNINVFPLLDKIDVNLFKDELIQKYIATYLNIVNDDKTSLTEVETIPSIYMRSVISLSPIVPSFYEIPSSLIDSPISNCIFDEDGKKRNESNSQQQLEPHNQKKFCDWSNQSTPSTTSIESFSHEYFSEPSKTQENPYYETLTFMNTSYNFDDNGSIDSQLPAFEDLMDIVSLSPATTCSTYSQTDELINTSEKHPSQQLSHRSTIPVNTNHDTIGKMNETVNHPPTLFVSGLRNDITAADIYRHFIGAVKVTLKRCQTTSHLKYAFVLHNTPKEAERNFLRPINSILLCPECHVEYGYNYQFVPIKHRLCDEKTVVVRKIPENVSENDLRRLFINCHLLKYCPARTVYRMATTTPVTCGAKILLGYAFLVYNNDRQAANVIEHADQYQINGQPLVISFYRNTKQLQTMTK